MGQMSKGSVYKVRFLVTQVRAPPSKMLLHSEGLCASLLSIAVSGNPLESVLQWDCLTFGGRVRERRLHALAW
eukprot:389519-Amphidinium_carterae.1